MAFVLQRKIGLISFLEKTMKYLKLIRLENLLLIAGIQYSFGYGFIRASLPAVALSHFEFALLVLATLCLTAGAYVMNDIQDIGTDEINKTKKVIVNHSVTENTAFNLYIGLNIFGVILAFYLSNLVGKPNLTGIFILVALTFYFYANQLKNIFLVGLLIKVLLSGLIILVLPLYEIYPLIDESTQTEYATLLKVMVDFAILTILLNLTREILKDLASKNGDYNEGYPTLPTVLGTKRTHFLSLILVLSMVILVSLYTYFYLWINNLYIATAYNLAFVLTPFIFVLIQLFSNQKDKEYLKMSKMLKYILLFACFSIVIITYTIAHEIKTL